KNNPSLDARCRAFESFLIVEKGFSTVTARNRLNNVRRQMLAWQTLMPAKEQVQALKEELCLKGLDREYVRNICLAFRNYGEMLGVDLAVKPPPRPKARIPKFLTEQEVQAFLFVVDSIRDRAIFTLLA